MKIDDLYQAVKEIRRDLHRIPEVAFDLPKTSAYVKEKLMEYGYAPISIAKTGWIVIIKGKSEESIAFRADMDALNVKEETDIDFKSTHEGKMHSCGHDGHMALLLGFAKYLSMIPKPEKSVVLIFQPAEESPGGAKVIMETGILAQLHVSKIFGFHLFPDLPEGILGLTKGPLMAMKGEFDIHVEGKSAHGGQPHLGLDALHSDAQIVISVQNIISRSLDSLEPAVISIGTFNSGEARNIVAGNAIVKGTIRSHDKGVYDKMVQRLQDICEGTMKQNGVKVTFSVDNFYPVVVNHEETVDKIIRMLDDRAYEAVKPLMLAEDFSFYQEKIPGVFIFLGSASPDFGYTFPLHSSHFNFNEKVLLKGIETYEKILRIEGGINENGQIN